MIRAILLIAILHPASALAEATLHAVTVAGLDEEKTANVLALLRLQALVGDANVREAQVRHLYLEAEDDIRRALQPFGHYRPRIEAKLESAPEGLRAHFDVDPGPAVTVRERRVLVEGAAAGDEVVAAAVGSFAPARDATLDHRRYEESKAAIERSLAARGYFDARRLRAVVRVHADIDRADIDIAWDSGERHRFGAVAFEGAQFPDAFMRPYADFESGEAYDAGRLLSMQQRMIEADYFGMVDVQVDGDDAVDLEVPVTVRVTPGKRRVFTAGAVLGTDSGLGVRGGIEWRWVNARGHKAEVQAELGQRRSALGGLYRIPLPGDLASWYNLALTLRDEETDTSESQVIQAKGERTFRYRGWDASLSANMQRERFTVAGTRDLATLIYPQLRVSRVVADDRVLPTRGFSLSGEIRLGAEALASDFDFAQFRIDAKYVRAFGTANRVLLRGSVGRTFTDRFDALPPSLRFFAGGDLSVRGYDYQALGPRAEDGQVIGGRNLLVASAEYERMFSESWGGAAFVDAGNAFGGDFDAALGAGFGVRWRSPIGPVRLDLARGFDRPEGFRLHLVIGPDL